MKTMLTTLACVLALASSASAQTVDRTGKWDVSVAGTQQGGLSAPLELKKDGARFVGVFSTPAAKRSASVQAPPKSAEPATSVDLTGTWALEVSTPNGVGRPTLELKQTAEKLSGQYSSTYGEFPVTGTITGAEFTFSIQMGVEGNTVSIIYTGKAE